MKTLWHGKRLRKSWGLNHIKMVSDKERMNEIRKRFENSLSKSEKRFIVERRRKNRKIAFGIIIIGLLLCTPFYIFVFKAYYDIAFGGDYKNRYDACMDFVMFEMEYLVFLQNETDLNISSTMQDFLRFKFERMIE